MKIGHYTEMYSSFFFWDVILLETEWSLEKIDESVNKTCKTHKLAGDLKIGHYTGNVFFCFSWDVILLETEWNLAKIDESVNKTCKTHKKHRIGRIQTCISLKINWLEIWKLVTRLEIYSFSLLRCNSSWNWMEPSEHWRICD